MYIEMKRIGETLTDDQKRWLNGLKDNGYCCYTADKGWEDAKNALVWYLNLKEEKDEA